jgi:hypothetical protein
MMKRGKNGQQLAAENVARVERWVQTRNDRRDWHEYEYSKRVNRRVLAEELGFAKSVCTQNRTVRAILESAEKLWFGLPESDRAAHEAAREKAEEHSGLAAKTNGYSIKRMAELEAEVHELRKQLSAFKQQQDLVAKGLAGFKV